MSAHPNIPPADIYATDPDRTADGAVKILREEIEHTLAAARLAHELTGPFAGSAADTERLEMIQVKILEIKVLTRRL